jgi:hypothetical protein
MSATTKPKKGYDTVKMVREIRDAIYRERHDPNFDPAEFKRIKAKWAKLLEESLKTGDMKAA